MSAGKERRGRGFVQRGIIGLVLALLAGVAAARDPDEVVHAFDLIVFRNEYREGVQQRVQRWSGPMRVYLDSRAGDPALQRRLVARHLEELARLTGLDIELVGSRSKANLLAVFERESRLSAVADELFPDADRVKQIMRSSVCLGRFYTNGRYEITQALVIIPPDRASARGLLVACVVEEITQVLGLPNDSTEVFPSIFNDKSIDTELTELDRTLIRILYHPRLTPGMSRDEALSIVRDLAGQIQERDTMPPSAGE